MASNLPVRDPSQKEGKPNLLPLFAFLYGLFLIVLRVIFYAIN